MCSLSCLDKAVGINATSLSPASSFLPFLLRHAVRHSPSLNHRSPTAKKNQPNQLSLSSSLNRRDPVYLVRKVGLKLTSASRSMLSEMFWVWKMFSYTRHEIEHNFTTPHCINYMDAFFFIEPKSESVVVKQQNNPFHFFPPDVKPWKFIIFRQLYNSSLFEQLISNF